MFTRHGALVLTATFLLAAGCSHPPAAHPSLAVAAAANLTEVLTAAGPVFESQTGIHPVFSFASTAQLEQQIENAAPFDVFLAADASHVDQLDQKRLLVSGSRAVYAIGVLALWIPPKSAASIGRIEDLASPSVRNIAIAKPELAPYGKAAVESLQAAGIWDQVQSKVVYAENIAMARQYGDSGNADAVFTAYSLVLHDAGQITQVDEKLHQSIEQALGILAASTHQNEARKFADFFLKGSGRESLRQYGYRFPLQ
jgi:molybdate transport system substrate-binding protein